MKSFLSFFFLFFAYSLLCTLRRDFTFFPYLQVVNASTFMNLTPAKRVTVQVRTLADRRSTYTLTLAQHP